MPICFHWYVVDLPRFDKFLDSTLGSLLTLYTEKGTDPTRGLSFCTAASGWVTYGSRLGQLYVWEQGGEHRPLGAQFEKNHPLLSLTARQHIREGSGSDVMTLLGCFSRCSATPFIKLLQVGESSRWWVGSLLDGVEASGLLRPDDYKALVILFKKLLRNIDCGKDLPGREYALGELQVPFLPRTDDGHHMGVWTQEEIETASKIIRLVRSREDIHFEAPAEDAPVTPRDGWNAWVHQQLDTLLRIESLDYEQPMFVSFLF